MKIINTTIVAAVCSLFMFACSKEAPVDNQLTRKEKKAGWQLLFDGESMDQWRRIYSGDVPESRWHVENGCLIIEALKDRASGGRDLVTVREYGNFDFTFEFKLTQGANSGVKYFVDESMGNPVSGYGYGPEYQVIDDVQLALSSEKIPPGCTIGGLYELIEAPATKKIKPIGEWNTGRIVSKDRHVEHWLNGDLMFSYVLGSDEFKALVQKSKFRNTQGYGEKANGHILLQDHGDKVSYKNLKIKEL